MSNSSAICNLNNSKMFLAKYYDIDIDGGFTLPPAFEILRACVLQVRKCQCC